MPQSQTEPSRRPLGMAGGVGHVTTGEKIKERLSKAKHTKAAELDELLGLIARLILACAGSESKCPSRDDTFFFFFYIWWVLFISQAATYRPKRYSGCKSGNSRSHWQLLGQPASFFCFFLFNFLSFLFHSDWLLRKMHPAWHKDKFSSASFPQCSCIT